jgi:putative ABC transport system ATP-binding protein
VFQSFNLVPTLTAEENITLPQDIAGHSIDRPWFDEVIGRLGIADRLSHRPSELSGGQQQRVAIARAIVTQPQVLLADEPTGNLDSQRSHEIMQLITRLNRERGITVLMVTHEADIAAYAQRIVHFRDGRIEREERRDTTAATSPEA